MEESRDEKIDAVTSITSFLRHLNSHYVPALRVLIPYGNKRCPPQNRNGMGFG